MKKSSSYIVAALAVAAVAGLMLLSYFKGGLLGEDPWGDDPREEDPPEEPGEEPEDQGSLQDILPQLEDYIAQSPHPIGLACYDFAEERMIEVDGYREIYPASMIKTLFL